MATTTKTAKKAKKGSKGTTRKVVEARPDSGAEKRAAAVDPFDTSGVAPNAGPTTKKGDNVYTADARMAGVIDKFVAATTAFKKAEADMKTAKGEVMEWSTGRFAAQYCEDGSRPKNPTLKGNSTAPKLIFADYEVKVDGDKWSMLQDLFGDKADETVTTHESFAFNPDFLDEGDNKDRIKKVLGAAFTADEVKGMIKPTVRRTTRKGSIDRVLGLLGEDVSADNVRLAMQVLTNAPSIR